MLLVADGVPGHLQAEDAQQVAGLSVEAGEVLQHVRVEGRAVEAHLQDSAAITPEQVRRSEEEQQEPHSPDRCTASPRVCG